MIAKEFPPDCIFLSPLDFGLIESELSPEKREEYGQKGYPRIELENGSTYIYIPVDINGKTYRLFPYSRSEI